MQTLVQADWEPRPTEIVPNWAPHLVSPALVIVVLVTLLDHPGGSQPTDDGGDHDLTLNTYLTLPCAEIPFVSNTVLIR